VRGKSERLGDRTCRRHLLLLLSSSPLQGLFLKERVPLTVACDCRRVVVADRQAQGRACRIYGALGLGGEQGPSLSSYGPKDRK